MEGKERLGGSFFWGGFFFGGWRGGKEWVCLHREVFGLGTLGWWLGLLGIWCLDRWKEAYASFLFFSM